MTRQREWTLRLIDIQTSLALKAEAANTSKSIFMEFSAWIDSIARSEPFYSFSRFPPPLLLPNMLSLRFANVADILHCHYNWYC